MGERRRPENHGQFFLGIRRPGEGGLSCGDSWRKRPCASIAPKSPIAQQPSAHLQIIPCHPFTGCASPSDSMDVGLFSPTTSRNQTAGTRRLSESRSISPREHSPTRKSRTRKSHMDPTLRCAVCSREQRDNGPRLFSCRYTVNSANIQSLRLHFRRPLIQEGRLCNTCYRDHYITTRSDHMTIDPTTISVPFIPPPPSSPPPSLPLLSLPRDFHPPVIASLEPQIELSPPSPSFKFPIPPLQSNRFTPTFDSQAAAMATNGSVNSSPRNPNPVPSPPTLSSFRRQSAFTPLQNPKFFEPVSSRSEQDIVDVSCFPFERTNDRKRE